MNADCPRPREGSIFRSDGIDFGPAFNFGVPADQVCQFYRDNWMRPVALSLPAFYDWQFLQPPEGGGLDWNCVAIKDDRLIGVMGISRRTFFVEGEPVQAAELTTWVVSDDARGTGAGRGILASLQAEYDFLAANSISTVALPVFIVNGFRYIAHLPRYFLVLDQEPLSEVLRVDRLGARLILDRQPAQASSYKAREVAAGQLGHLAETGRQSINGFERGQAWLAWRYDAHPTFKYRAYVVTSSDSGHEIGVVVRQDRTADFSFIHVVDLVGDPAAIPAAVQFIEDFGRETGSSFVDVTATNSAFAAGFRAAGWFSINDDEWAQLSHLFHPPQWRQPATSSAAIWSRHKPASAYDAGKIHITKGDMDLDRPTMDYYAQHGLGME